jgi:predicted nucleic acid-binding protein
MEEKIKVFLDSNVLFSITYTGRTRSRAYLLFELQEIGMLEIYLSPLVCEEASINIKLKKPENFGFLSDLITRSEIVENILLPTVHPFMKDLPQNDRIILMTAVYHGMDYFLTGNEKDFFNLYNHRIDRTVILKPADFLHGPAEYLNP